MRRRIALVVLAASLLGRVSAGDQNEPRSLFAKKHWVRFDLVLGRLTATQIRGGRQNCLLDASSTGGPRELLSVTGESHAPAVSYERTDRHQRLHVEILGRNRVTIRREAQPGSETVPLEFVQPQQGPVSLRLGAPNAVVADVEAKSLWHLLLAEPVLCRHQLLPVLKLLRPHWRLMESAERIETSLLRAAAEGDAVTLAHVRELVDALDQPQFQARRRADQQLRSLGILVLARLEQLDRTTLTREQRQRIERIERDLALMKVDSPERIAAWMLNDTSVWLAILSRGDVEAQQLAASRLAETEPTATQFDPRADAAQQRRQIETLRLRISARR